MEYGKLFKALYEEDVRYLICGGLAVNVYGIPRMTADIDILLDFESKNIRRFEELVERLDFTSLIPIKLNSLASDEAREEVIKDKNLIAFSFYNTRSNYMNLDVLIDVPFSFDDMWSSKETRKFDDVSVFIVSLNHLISMKRYANRNQDKQDVIMLSKLNDL